MQNLLKIICLALAALVVFQFLQFASIHADSFWLDECISVWIANQPVSEVISQSISYQGQSPLYYLILHFWMRLFGDSEMSARMPSLICLTLITLGIYFYWRPHSQFSALSAICAFLVTTTATVLCSARPYAAAVLFAFIAIAAFMKWIESARDRWLALSALASIFCFYFHYLFISILLVKFAILLIERAGRTAFKKSAVSCAAVLLCALPGVGQLLSLKSRSAELSFGGVPGFTDVILALFREKAVLALGFGLMLSFICCGGVVAFNAERKRGRILFVWYLTGPLFLLALSLFLSSSLWIERYHAWSVVALPMLVGWVVAGFTPRVYQACLSVWLIGYLYVAGPTQFAKENWSSAANAVNSIAVDDTLVLAQTGLIEANRLSNLESEVMRGYLLAPLRVYSVRGELRPLPAAFNTAELQDYERNTLSSELADRESFVLIARGQPIDENSTLSTVQYYLSYFREKGFNAQPAKLDGIVRVFRMRKQQ